MNQMATDSTIMHIGLGHPAGAVALFLDEDGICCFSHGTIDGPHNSFRSGDRQHQFDSHATISHHQARAAAAEFTQTHHRPTTIRWRQEPS